MYMYVRTRTYSTVHVHLVAVERFIYTPSIIRRNRMRTAPRTRTARDPRPRRAARYRPALRGVTRTRDSRLVLDGLHRAAQARSQLRLTGILTKKQHLQASDCAHHLESLSGFSQPYYPVGSSYGTIIRRVQLVKISQAGSEFCPQPSQNSAKFSSNPLENAATRGDPRRPRYSLVHFTYSNTIPTQPLVHYHRLGQNSLLSRVKTTAISGVIREKN